MTKTRFLLLALFVLGVITLMTIPSQFEVTITERDIQSILDKQIGREIPVPGLVGVAVHKMRADKLEAHLANGQLTFVGAATGSLASGDEFSLSVQAIGVPRYQKGEVFFDAQDARITDISYNRSAFKEKIIGLSGVFGDRTQGKVAKKLETLDKWENGAATRLLTYTLEKHPVYKIKDELKGVFVRAALDRMTVMNDYITFVFSLWSLTVWTLGSILTFVGVALYLVIILRSPF